MKPIIGIIGRPFIRDNQVRLIGIPESLKNYVISAGAIPMVIVPPQNVIYNDTKGCDIPPITDDEKNNLIRMIKLCNGIIIPGGSRCYEYDHFIADYLIKEDIPSLGICMGMQILVNTNNGTYYGGSNEKNNTSINHKQPDTEYVHNVNIKKGTYLHQIIGEDNIKVNSMHNYHITHTNNFIVSSISEDGLIEGVENPGKKFMIGIQWHPEKIFNSDEPSRKIISEFIKACK